MRPASFFLATRCWPLLCVALIVISAGCSERFNWREVRVPEAQLAFVLPDKPQSGSREFNYDGPGGPAALTMKLSSTGVGATLFAVSTVQLPAAALEATQLQKTLDWFAERSLRNVQGQLQSSEAVKLPSQALAQHQLRAARQLQARGTALRSSGKTQGVIVKVRLAIVDDQLVQMLVLWNADDQDAAIPAETLDMFFDSLRFL